MKHIFKSLNMAVILLFVFGGMLVWNSVPEVIIALKPAVSFDDMLDEETELKAGMHVSGQVPYVLDSFAEESTYTRNSDGSRTGSKASGKYYMVPTASSFIAMKSHQTDVKTLDKLVDETWDYMMGGAEPTTEFSMEGHIEVLDDAQLIRYYNEYLEELGYSESEIADLGTPLLVRPMSFTSCWVLLGIGILLLAIGILLFRRGYRISKYGSARRRTEPQPYVPPVQTPDDGSIDSLNERK